MVCDTNLSVLAVTRYKHTLIYCYVKADLSARVG